MWSKAMTWTPVVRRAFHPIWGWDVHVSGMWFFDRLPYCDGDLERWADDGGREVRNYDEDTTAQI
jgi:hypothetical protein